MTRRIATRPFTFLFSVIAAAAALILPMLCAAIAVQVWPVPLRLAVEPELSVFVAPGAGGADVKALMARLSGLPAVAEVRLVSRDEALGELTGRRGLESAAGAIAELKSNPLPDVLVARLAAGTSAEAIDELVAGVRKWNRVDAVAADTGWYRKWSQWQRLLAFAASALAAVAWVLLVWVIVSAVRLQAAADREEVHALLVFGADAHFVRRPYVYLGAATTGLSMAVALVTVALTLHMAAPLVATLSGLYGLTLTVGQPPMVFFIAALLGAAATGGLVAGLGVQIRADRGR